MSLLSYDNVFPSHIVFTTRSRRIYEHVYYTITWHLWISDSLSADRNFLDLHTCRYLGGCRCCYTTKCRWSGVLNWNLYLLCSMACMCNMEPGVCGWYGIWNMCIYIDMYEFLKVTSAWWLYMDTIYKDVCHCIQYSYIYVIWNMIFFLNFTYTICKGNITHIICTWKRCCILHAEDRRYIHAYICIFDTCGIYIYISDYICIGKMLEHWLWGIHYMYMYTYIYRKDIYTYIYREERYYIFHKYVYWKDTGFLTFEKFTFHITHLCLSVRKRLCVCVQWWLCLYMYKCKRTDALKILNPKP